MQQKYHNLSKWIVHFEQCLIVFFQDEEHVRDSQESRGLIDVYKKQKQIFTHSPIRFNAFYPVTTLFTKGMYDGCH